MAPALNQCIHRYIPGHKVLLVHVEKLFAAYANTRCTTKKTQGAFFSDEAKEMAENLLETVRKGYLSHPPHVSGKRFRNREYTDGFGSCNAGGEDPGKREGGFPNSAGR
ncbi:hypothetical protein B0H17DRAFT_1124962 [Mycena rosella]|uniref:Uncharacterized protein n=1 Tax=Mycena rosella TaxID=1033263 RepID=A0AAD7MAP5_MYCRO|nr:hypothetical protein B0H17DRAFT_1124962 [Mycena rosella]